MLNITVFNCIFCEEGGMKVSPAVKKKLFRFIVIGHYRPLDQQGHVKIMFCW